MKKLFVVLALGLLASAQTFGQSHGHLNIGAVGTNQNDALDFDNGALFATNSGYIMTLNYTNAGVYAGYYGGNITLTALAQTAPFGGPVPGAPAVGSTIYAQIVSVEGPTGGSFGFWDVGATNPTISLACGTIGTNGYKVSQNDGSPGSDPYGHIHGRQFTATKPGIYLVGFRALDLSTNGINGGPIQSPSDVLKFYFQAGVNISSISSDAGGASVTFGAPGGRNCTLEYSSSLTSTNWTFVAGPTLGTDSLQTLTDSSPTEAQRFYRIRLQ